MTISSVPTPMNPKVGWSETLIDPFNVQGVYWHVARPIIGWLARSHSIMID
jgi:hypothetical protein